MAEGVYGAPHPDLAEIGAGARQLSPLVLEAEALEDLAPGDLERLVIAAPPGVLERRHVLAQALRVLPPGGELVAMAPKDRGGSRLGAELAAFGCEVAERGARHQRVCVTVRPDQPVGLEAAIAQGEAQVVPALGLWSQPGVFSWDRLDPGSALLLEHVDGLAGRGADLGCGIGVLTLRALASAKVIALTAIDLDRRAVAAARRNLVDPRAVVVRADLRRAPSTASRSPSPKRGGMNAAETASIPPPLGEGDQAQPGGGGMPQPQSLDFVIMNPPFHDGGVEDRRLGQVFIERASALLRKGGVLRLVANVGMPYEATLAERFTAVKPLAQAKGYKLIEARR